MKKVFIIHGFQSDPNGHWKPWLMGELAKIYVYACSLPMPKPNEPQKSEWLKMIGDCVEIPDGEIFLVGHSLGSVAVLRYLESLPEGVQIGGAVLVAGPCKILKSEDEDVSSKLRKIDHFLDTPINFDYIKKKAKNFVVIHGDNDLNVPIEHGKIISENLGCNLVVVPNGGHLGTDAKMWQLPEALKALQDMFKD